MKNIVLIGFGMLGERHLQSLISLRDEYQLWVMDKYADTIMSKKDKYPENIKYSVEYDDLPEQVELAVIATTADVRKDVFARLIEHSDVRNILFEKVLFQKKEDFDICAGLLKENKISAWVNCARREWDSYHRLKDYLSKKEFFDISVSGGEWGLGCNGIHMLDLVEYLSDSTDLRIKNSVFDGPVTESKRKGFYEIYGTISGDCGKCRGFTVKCCRNSVAPLLFSIITEDSRIVVDESKELIYVSTLKDSWKWTEEPFNVVYQSALTSVVAKKILETGTCDLPDFDTSKDTHILFMDEMRSFFLSEGRFTDRCPIT